MVPDILKVERARHSADLFPNGADLEKVYRALAKKVHPDKVPPDWKERATRAFAKLSGWYAELTRTTSAEVWLGDWVIRSPFAKGDICDLYLAESVSGKRGVLKIARDPDDGDLIEAEQSALAMLARVSSKAYFPEVLATFTVSERLATVMKNAEGFLTLKDILEVKGKLDFRHVVWMMNRALSALGYAHHNKLVHGSITPEHLMYHPAEHALMLVDWCYSAKEHGRIPAVVTAYRSLYPQEVLRKEQCRPQSDVYMLAKVLLDVAVYVPKRFRPFFDWCTLESSEARPGVQTDAWDLQERWKALAQDEYGPPAFVKLEIPAN